MSPLATLRRQAAPDLEPVFEEIPSLAHTLRELGISIYPLPSVEKCKGRMFRSNALLMSSGLLYCLVLIAALLAGIGGVVTAIGTFIWALVDPPVPNWLNFIPVPSIFFSALVYWLDQNFSHRITILNEQWRRGWPEDDTTSLPASARPIIEKLVAAGDRTDWAFMVEQWSVDRRGLGHFLIVRSDEENREFYVDAWI